MRRNSSILTLARGAFFVVAMTAPRLATGAPQSTGSTTNPVDYATAHLERIVHALRVTQPITLDGRLDEPAWKQAEPATHFLQWEPNPGMPASDETEVRILYDADNLYVGARCWDSDPAHIIVNELQEDFQSNESDNLGVFIDTLHDRQSGFYFSTNPAGARRDVQASRDGDQNNQDWDGVWDVRVSIDEAGWIAEFIIPFKTLRFSSAAQQEWGLQVLRRARRTNQDSHWAPLPRRYRTMRASLAGTLTGLEGIRQGRNLKIKPYAISSLTELGTAPGARDVDGDGGLDLKYGITQSMTLDLTYRTEFSQVEADQQQVNLTRFNLLFPEKREFFLENAGIFAVAGGGGPGGGAGANAANIIPFFSRRIGLSSSGVPIPIVGGARMSGRAGAYDVGVLAMKTRSEGELPSNTFLVGRLRRNFRGSSTAGAIVTSRDSTLGGDYNRMYGVDTLLRLFEKLEVSSYLLRSETPGRRGRDQARRLGATWRDNDVTAGGEYEEVQPNFNPEAGFVQRSNMRHYSGDLTWRPRPGNSHIRNFILSLTSDYYEGEQRRVETREQRANAGIAFQNSSNLGFTATNTFDRLTEPFAIRPAVIIPVGDYMFRRYSANYNTDRSRMIAGSLNASAGEFWDGRSRTIGGSLELKPSHHLNIETTFSRNNVRLPHGDFVTTLVGTRVLWAFTSKAFLNSFLQYNATTKQFSVNTRFNVMHRPLSDLYVVYNERRDTESWSLIGRGLIVKFTNMFDF